MPDEPRPFTPPPNTPPLAPEPSEPPLDDPYLIAPTPVQPGLSRMAVQSAVALPFGPVGAVLAIILGYYARREIERAGRRRSGYALATASMVLGVLAAMSWGAGLSYWKWTREHRVDPVDEAPEVIGTMAPPPSPRPSPRAVPDVGPFAPRHTKVKRDGEITVVDVGASTSSIGEELAKQRAEAASQGETLLVMTTAGRCDPCRGVDQSLADPRLQAALAKVRLVRVDVEVFPDDLDELKIPHAAIPGFFLLSPDLTPRDGVDGGEWDDDIAANIAPVLGPFLRGKYASRRRPWRALPPSGTTL